VTKLSPEGEDMKISSANLEAVKELLVNGNAKLTEATAAKVAADENHTLASAKVRGLQGAFDICTSAFVNDGDLGLSQLNDLPQEAQAALGYQKGKPPAA
jgi:hypothetical protein